MARAELARRLLAAVLMHIARGESDQGRSGVQFQLGAEVFAMIRHGVGAKVQFAGDLLAGMSPSDQLENFRFLWS